MSLKGGNVFMWGIIYTWSIWDQMWFPKTLGADRNSTFLFVFSKKIKKWKHVVLQQHGMELAALSDFLVSMHLPSWKWLFTRGRFFPLNGSLFLVMSDLMQMYPWKMGMCKGNPLTLFLWGNTATCQVRNSLLWLEAWSPVSTFLWNARGETWAQRASAWAGSPATLGKLLPQLQIWASLQQERHH